jgi:hypothetical protein
VRVGARRLQLVRVIPLTDERLGEIETAGLAGMAAWFDRDPLQVVPDVAP